MWQLKWGSEIEFLEDVESKTGETPPALLNRPKANLWTQEYISAYDTLSASRQSSMDQNPISFEAIDRYATRFEIEDFELFCLMIQHMDHERFKYFKQLEEAKKNV